MVNPRGERWMRSRDITDILKPIVEKDLREAVRTIRKILAETPQGNRRADLLRGAIFALAAVEGGAPLAVEFWEQVPPSGDSALLGKVLVEKWDEENPAAATRWAKSLPRTPGNDLILAAAFENDPTPGNATAILEALEGRNWEYSFQDEARKTAVYYSSKYAAGGLRSGGVTSAVRQALSRVALDGDPEGALQQAANIPDSIKRRFIIQKVVEELEQTDPLWLLERYQTFPISEGHETRVLTSIVRNAVARDPDAAAQIAEGYTNAELRERILGYVANPEEIPK